MKIIIFFSGKPLIFCAEQPNKSLPMRFSLLMSYIWRFLVAAVLTKRRIASFHCGQPAPNKERPASRCCSMVHATSRLTAESIYSAQSREGNGRIKEQLATKRSKQAEKNRREPPLIEPVSGRRVKRSTFFIFVVVVVDGPNIISNTHRGARVFHLVGTFSIGRSG
jgi:hypothetical protein